MYHVGKRIHKHHTFWKRLTWLSLFLLFVVGAYWLLHLQITPTQNVHSSAPVSKSQEGAKTKIAPFEVPLFKLELPAGWKHIKAAASPVPPTYSFLSPTDQAAQLDMYIDNPPTTMALNKAIAINISDNAVVHDSVSDNCTTYTEASKKDPRTGTAPAKWQGIDFLCDMANYNRAVVGTVSHDGFNYFIGTTTKGVTHKVFITYTDNSINPNYTPFYDILNSLHFK